MKPILNPPCVFCGYNGREYWQPKTHDIGCPWRSIGSEVERSKRLRAVMRQHYTDSLSLHDVEINSEEQ